MADAAGEDAATSAQPARMRTWWHPLLVRLFDLLLRDAYEVREEVSVGTLPLRVDIVLIRRRDGELSASARRDLSAVVERLNRITLVEFKSPTDVLEKGDLDRLLGCAHLFRAQEAEPIANTEMSLIVLAPSLSQPFVEDLQQISCSLAKDGPGVHRIDGPVFTTRVIETNAVTGPDEPVLSLFSRVFHRDRRSIMKQLQSRGQEGFLHYVIQQIHQFRSLGEDFTMQHSGTEYLGKTLEEMRAEFVKGLTAEERLKGMSVEERLAGLTAEEIEYLREKPFKQHDHEAAGDD